MIWNQSEVINPSGTLNFLRVPSPGIIRYVALVKTGVSEELIASITRVTRIGDLGTTSAVTNYRGTL
jgi:hypothetical protein